MDKFILTISVCHDALTWKENRWFEEEKYEFETFAEVQAFLKEKDRNNSLPHSGAHYIVLTRGEKTLVVSRKRAYWSDLYNGDYSDNPDFN
jgi:hypothetical protein